MVWNGFEKDCESQKRKGYKRPDAPLRGTEQDSQSPRGCDDM